MDYTLGAVNAMLSVLDTPDMAEYVYVAATGELVATSTGEILTSPDGLSTKLASAASNFMIRESFTFLANNHIASDGFYSYTGVDQLRYVLQLSSSKTISWKTVVVSLDADRLLLSTGDALLVQSCIGSDLTAFTDDAIYPANYIAFLTGKNRNVPLATPIIETATQPKLKGLTQQTLWGCISAFSNSQSVWIGFSDKTFLMYSRIPFNGYANTYDYKPALNSGMTGYSVASDGVPVSSISSVSYDPTTVYTSRTDFI
jgi:hypothetical protein